MTNIQAQQKIEQGYKLRSVTFDDLQLVTELINNFSQHTMGINDVTAAELDNFWRTPGLSMEDDIRLLFSADGKALGYVETLVFDNPPVHPYIFLRVDPEFVESDVPELLLDWAIERGGQVLDILPTDLRVSLAAHNASGFAPMQHVYESRGFVLNRLSFQMEIEMKEAPALPQWPMGIELREVDTRKEIEAIYRAHDEAFSDHFGHIEQPFESGLARFIQMTLEDKEGYDPSLWFIAMDGDQIAGYSLCRLVYQEAEPGGWISILGVRRPWRKRGLGMALLLHSFGEFYKRGQRKVGLGVDASNLTGALKLYERAGMHVAHRNDRYEKELRPGKELMTTEIRE